jgi:hypothetical protein
VRREERLHAPAKVRVAAARLGEERASLGRRLFEGEMKQRFFVHERFPC